jgi:hypothetical protein
MLLLHCVPGPPSRKAQALIRLARLLRDDGILFGATILGKGVKHNLMGRWLMDFHNKKGIFDNKLDDIDGLINPLKIAFEEVKLEVTGRTLLFSARRPRAIAGGKMA